jgi:iron complex outermembrane receptor protein
MKKTFTEGTKNMSKQTWLLLGATSLMGLNAPGVAQAQAQGGATPQAQATDQASGGDIGDIIVTARRTAESVQTVPVTVTAVNSESLRRNNIQSIVDIQRLVPGITINAGVGGAATAALAIRGQVAGDHILTVDPAVGVYLDEVLIPRGVGVRPAQFDLSSVQVLEGPQGTLFGKNTTGGALLLTTNRPGNELGGYVDLQLTEYKGRRVTAAIDLPIIEDKLLTRIALQRVRRDGYGQDRLGNPTNDENVDSIRASFIARPLEDVEIFGSYDDSIANAHSQNPRLTWVLGCTGPNQCSGVPLPTALTAPLPRYDVNGNLIPGTYGAGFGSAIFSEVAAEQGQALTPANLTAAQNLLSTFLPGGANDPGFYNTGNSLSENRDKFRGRGGTLQVNVEKAGLTFRSITGYRKTFRDAGVLYSPFNLPGPIPTSSILPNGSVINRFTAIGGLLETSSHSFTQEVQIQRQNSGSLDFTIGAYYQSESGNEGGPSYQAPALSPGSVPVINDGHVTNTSYSGYAQFVYHLTPTIRVTAGGRYTHDKKGITSHNGAGVGAPFANGVIDAVANPALAPTAAAALVNPGENCSLDPSILPAGSQPYLTVISAAGTRRFFSRDYAVCTASRSKGYNSTNWLASVDWRPNSDLLLYAKAATGYKAGGFNLRLTNAAGLMPFQPEKTREIELGVKSTWLGGRLRVNADVYHTKYTDIQRNQIVAVIVNGALGQSSVIGNAASATIKGFEGSINFTPLEGLNLSAAGSYVRGKYDRYLIPVAFNPTTGAPTAFNDLSDFEFPLPTATNLPHYQYTLGASYRLPLDWGDATFNANWSWQSRQPFHASNPARDYIRVPAYGLLNLQAAVKVDRLDAEFSVFARNALDKKYFTGFNDTSSFGYIFSFTGEPRVIGVGVRKNF